MCIRDSCCKLLEAPLYNCCSPIGAGRWGLGFSTAGCGASPGSRSRPEPPVRVLPPLHQGGTRFGRFGLRRARFRRS
eukprot:12880853-Alexandrium_andersonii.AAC.1